MVSVSCASCRADDQLAPVPVILLSARAGAVRRESKGCKPAPTITSPNPSARASCSRWSIFTSSFPAPARKR